MKIGILTFHYAHNYGAVLQTFALLSKLKEMGHDAYIIDRRPDFTNIPRWIYHHIAYKHVWGWLKFDASVRKLLQPQTRRYETQSSIQRHFAENQFDAVAVGSDQVWRWEWRMIGFNYFLDFITDRKIKKIAYAASFGLSEWKGTMEDTVKVKKLLEDFSAVSVREKDGVKISKDIFGVNAQLVLDPTLLFDRSFYECQLLSNKVVISNNKVVSIMLSQPELSVLQMKWAKKRGLLHIDLSNTLYDCRDLKNHTEFHWQHVTVQRWLEEIRSARYVITNSFHATIFCLLFEKQFVTLSLVKGGTNRIETLLSYVGLEHLRVHDMKEMDSIIELPIDYVSVHEKLNNLRRKSLCFLDEALK